MEINKHFTTWNKPLNSEVSSFLIDFVFHFDCPSKKILLLSLIFLLLKRLHQTTSCRQHANFVAIKTNITLNQSQNSPLNRNIRKMNELEWNECKSVRRTERMKMKRCVAGARYFCQNTKNHFSIASAKKQLIQFVRMCIYTLWHSFCFCFFSQFAAIANGIHRSSRRFHKSQLVTFSSIY